jgi:hypothetical protein
MKKIAVTFIPLMLAGGLMLPAENCSNVKPHTTNVDGPYVLYKNDLVYVKYIVDDHGTKKVKADSMPVAQKNTINLVVATDEPGKYFTASLQPSLENEPTEYPDVSKMFIVSDIEGNFAAFRKLLLAGSVIDANFNWTFGDGHLVLTGDFVDRGSQVNEVLWLIYSLETKAKAAGGKVHFILGNHEIMNMSGDLRYVHAKYTESSVLLKEHFTALYGDQSELGKWLRTKNIVEKISGILFTHGGISGLVNRLNVSATDINQLARPYYADSTFQYTNPKLDTLFSDFGPFWYRGYYTGNTAVETRVIDSTLDIFKVKKIATGHTVIADSIRSLYNGKLFNTDVHHARGHSEAVLMEGNKFYRVLPNGERKLLME